MSNKDNKTIQAKDKTIIALTGMMGSGKTTIGMRLAQRLKMPFKDSDKEIEKQLAKTTNQIFEEDGEEYFRQIESQIINDITKQKKPLILSLGGGAFTNENIRNLIKKECVSIWLSSDLEVILERVGNKTHRPLLNNVDKREVLSKLIKERTPFYKQCDIKINSGSNSHEETVNDIIAKLQQII